MRRVPRELMNTLAPTLLIAAAAIVCPAAADDRLRNWFDDPFFQVSSDLADCPLPAGPFVDERERRVQAHRRAEKGTTCWLAGACERPNAFAYDRDIAEALRAALAARPSLLAGTSVWITVQGRVVYLEGCAARDDAAASLESLARSVPHVEQAIAALRTAATARPPYRVRAPRRAPGLAPRFQPPARRP